MSLRYKLNRVFRDVFCKVDSQEKLFDDFMNFEIPSYIIDRLQKDYNVPDEKIEQIVIDFKLYFSLFIISERKVYAMPGNIKEVDDLWHVYLLYTNEYSFFCNKFFGRFIRHIPDNSVVGFNQELANSNMKNTWDGLVMFKNLYDYKYDFDFLNLFNNIK